MPLKTPITCKLQSGITKNAQSVVHVRSTGLFVTDPVLRKQRAPLLVAPAGFENPGTSSFNAPLGRACYDSMISAIAVRELLYRAPHCSDEANAAPSILWWSIRGAAEERQGCKPTDPRSHHRQWRVSRLRGGSWGSGAGVITAGASFGIKRPQE
jgi:hypothetical protein